MVEVYKTNVRHKAVADEIVRDLCKAMPGSLINFDLEDCDKVLRIVHETIPHSLIEDSLSSKGYYCEVLQ